ncbi:hypothetical protein Nepgr_002878 [Nepenthes gracilis]|uniref:Glycolipid transfer protein domain-containing protein n=1 Tax=Nepenthes gracilis TaxID=150966 RepID=A0AAD3RY33_NEPGR|nr:hypothetical protein Nepgr_002878 [Nepenthes gracilis]
MKRRRESEKKSEIRSTIEELSMAVKLKPAAVADRQASHIPTGPFLSVCNFILQLLDKIGPTMTVLRNDIFQNIQRLETLCESDPATYSNSVEMLKKEAVEGNARKVDSCSRALVWLTRSLDLLAILLQKLASDGVESMEEMVEDSYNKTMKPWHGWISATAYRVALKLLPDKQTLMDLLMAKGQNLDSLKDEIKTLISLLVPFLEDAHSILRSYGLDRLKSP